VIGAKIVVHTDVILEHLYGTRRPSVLRSAMGMYFCYTTVFQAVEVFAVLRTERERQAAVDAISSPRIPRSAPWTFWWRGCASKVGSRF